MDVFPLVISIKMNEYKTYFPSRGLLGKGNLVSVFYSKTNIIRDYI